MTQYGKQPANLGQFDFDVSEVFYYLYLPVSLPNQIGFTLPKQLFPFISLLTTIRSDNPERFERDYVYFTGKRMYVSPTISANRQGWHSDGFGTSDLNYIWFDSLPTVFNNGPFVDIPNDDKKALDCFQEQALPQNNYEGDVRALLRLDSSVIHQVQAADHHFMRTFVKVSISEHQYNLSDNSINHDLDYSWDTYSRDEARNSPNFAGKDFMNANGVGVTK